MTLDDLIKKYSGKFVEVAGSPGAENQCVDIVNQYLRDVLNLPIIQWTDAKNFPNHPIAKEHFEYIKNTPMAVPQKGDLIIWSNTQWGHIAICLFADVELPWFTSFDQNWPTGSTCHKVDHSYSNVVGWLRPKGENMSNELAECLKQHDKLMGIISEQSEKVSKYDEFKKGGFDHVGVPTQLIQDLRGSIQDKNEVIKIEKARADDWRDEYNGFISTLARDDYLHCTQEKNEILAQAAKAGYNLKQAEDISRAFSAFKEEASGVESSLKSEILRLQTLLKQENVLENAKLEELLREILNRLIKIVRKR